MQKRWGNTAWIPSDHMPDTSGGFITHKDGANQNRQLAASHTSKPLHLRVTEINSDDKSKNP